MNDKLRTTLLTIVAVILVFLIFSISPPRQSTELQGNLVIQQPASLQQESITDDILLSSGTGSLRGEINLADWKTTEIAKAIARYNPRLDPAAYNYKYNEDCSYYAQYGEVFGKDPFCNIIYAYQGLEWNDGHLRIEHLDYDSREPADTKYKEYVNDILKETQIDPSLTCFTQKECNNIDVIICTKDNHNHFSWFQGQVLFTSVDDARRNLNAFTRFYCSSELKPLTGSIVSSLVEKDYIINKLAAIIKRLS